MSLALAAGTAVNLIAAEVAQPGAGLFAYSNTALNLSRLAYSTDFAFASPDFKALARFTDQVGQAGIEGSSRFTTAGFAVTDVPEG